MFYRKATFNLYSNTFLLFLFTFNDVVDMFIVCKHLLCIKIVNKQNINYKEEYYNFVCINYYIHYYIIMYIVYTI